MSKLVDKKINIKVFGTVSTAPVTSFNLKDIARSKESTQHRSLSVREMLIVS
jgi:hypothetical protein